MVTGDELDRLVIKPITLHCEWNAFTYLLSYKCQQKVDWWGGYFAVIKLNLFELRHIVDWMRLDVKWANRESMVQNRLTWNLKREGEERKTLFYGENVKVKLLDSVFGFRLWFAKGHTTWLLLIYATGMSLAWKPRYRRLGAVLNNYHKTYFTVPLYVLIHPYKTYMDSCRHICIYIYILRKKWALWRLVWRLCSTYIMR